MANEKTFAVGGLAQVKETGEWQVKFAQEAKNRTKVLERGGWINVQFVEFDKELTKDEGMAFLKALPQFADAEMQKAFEAPVKAEKAAKEKKEKAPKAPKAKATVKVQKAVIAKPTNGDKPKITGLTVEEIEDIKNKNNARLAAKKGKGVDFLKKVHKNYVKGQVAEGAEGGFTEEQEAEARAYVESVNNDLDSFKAPEFLTMDEVKSLI